MAIRVHPRNLWENKTPIRMVNPCSSVIIRVQKIIQMSFTTSLSRSLTNQSFL